MTAPDPSHAAVGWRPSPAQTGAALVAVVCLVAAFLFGRVELVLIAAPLAVTALVDRARRPDDGADAAVRPVAATEPIGEASRPTVVVAVEAEAAPGTRADAVHLRLAAADRPPFDVVLSLRAAARLRLEVAVGHSGPQRVLSVEARALGADASWTGEPAGGGGDAVVERVVRPVPVHVRSLPLPARLLGLTGPHVSARPGDGGEFRDVDRYRAGDRLRRIDWKATARRAQRPGELYVRRTTATSDAAVQLVIDARDDLPAEVADWAVPYPRPGIRSLDIAREAATSLASAYAAAGDRVGFDDLAAPSRALPPRAGARHRHAVLRSIETTAARGAVAERVRPPRLAPGALVYILSTFLDDQPVRLALAWRAAGHRVIVVDVLPVPTTGGLAERDRIALRLVSAERDVRFQRLAAAGAELLVWASADRDARLKRLAAPQRRAVSGRPA
ncbi:DUF58 domain-containing protein [Leifsonia sp. NPDC058194]|uniref:DUF58 domain-containing protein n=1 Tax=Leifsonia sp. NPDC058194 TaxID=3346374 RepID=UPI0036D9F1D1